MGMFKSDFYRFFAFGFVAGAVLVAGTMNSSMGSTFANTVVPVAEAQSAR